MTDRAKHNGSSPTPDELRAQVERTREELGRTVEALAAKVDVKAHAQQTAAKVKGVVQGKAASANEQLTQRAHTLGHKMHDRSREPDTAEGGPVGRGAHTNRNLLVLAGVAATLAVVIVVVAQRGRRRC